MGVCGQTDHLNGSSMHNVTPEGTCWRSVFNELFWGGITGTAIASALGVPSILLTQWLACSHLQFDGRLHLMSLGTLLVSSVLGIMLLVIMTPAIRKSRVGGDANRQHQTPDLRSGAKLGSIIGAFLCTGTTLYVWFALATIFSESRMPVEAWHLAAGITVSVICILAGACLGALAVCAGLVVNRELSRKQSHQASTGKGPE